MYTKADMFEMYQEHLEMLDNMIAKSNNDYKKMYYEERRKTLADMATLFEEENTNE